MPARQAITITEAIAALDAYALQEEPRVGKHGGGRAQKAARRREIAAGAQMPGMLVMFDGLQIYDPQDACCMMVIVAEDRSLVRVPLTRRHVDVLIAMGGGA